MPDINQLPHVSKLNNIEQNFKVYAGPGAGKTTWLIKHLEKVLRNSKRLGKTRKIACITYTNVAADQVINGLNCSKSRFEVSTIHSFLYNNVVKPFSHLIEKKDNGEILFNTEMLVGHDEHIVQGDRLRRWIKTISKLNKKNYNVYHKPENKLKVITELSSLDYVFKDGLLELITRQHRGAKLPKSNGELWLYKEKYWKDGIMHHEDVLYFSYLILSRSSKIIEFIRSKFPYVFVDEFQDTTELQTWILEKICKTQTKIGIVGDLGQSIYKFTGAKRKDFVKFKKEDISEYKIDINHRSTKNIITFLNELRSDINQTYNSDVNDGSYVEVFVGEIQNAQKKINQNLSADELLYILTRKNKSVSEINEQIALVDKDLLKEIYSQDSNSSRAKLIHSIIMGYKYHVKDDYKHSMTEILKPLKRARNKNILNLQLRKIAIDIIEKLKQEDEREKTICDFYLNLRENIHKIYGLNIGSNLKNGFARTFYENHTINQLLPYVKVDTKSDDLVRTIHSAKGTEFNNVMVHFDSTDDFRKYILDCQEYIDGDDDDARIYYVACSRAKKRLFFNIPVANEEDLKEINSMNINYQKV
jgi:DNA helicase-2/ATP-dependent DNA helicase PcrA